MGDMRQQDQALAQDGPPITMYLKARSENGTVEWDLGNQNPPAKGKQAVVVDGAARDIVIHLVPTSGLDIRFDTSDPVWTGKNSSCPPPEGNNCPDQIDRIDCMDRKLTMHDTNSEKCTITYQMNFIGAAPCDPEIRNGGIPIISGDNR